MTGTEDVYYTILGVSTSATVDEIKRAYRQKSKELHPDKNANPDANEQFILLNEAYEYLLELKTGKVKANADYYQNWQDNSREEAYQRAKEYAQMRYREFLKSDRYKAIFSLDVIVNHTLVILLACTIILAPVLAAIYLGLPAAIATLLPISLIIYFLIFKVRETVVIDFKLYIRSLKYIANTRGFVVAVFIVFNLYVFFNIELQTLLPLKVFPIVILCPAMVIYLVVKWVNKVENKLNRVLYSFCFWPFAVSIFFLTNFIFSTNPVKEKYPYSMSTQGVRGGSKGTSSVMLEGNAYAEYPALRYFFSFEEVKTHNTVTYTFADGLFGMRVMKTYEFTLE